MKKTVQLAGREVRRVGFGCMNVSHAYGNRPTEAEAIALLHAAIDAGYDHLDTAALYGAGNNERLLGQSVMARRDEYLLASKCGMLSTPEGKVIDGQPSSLRRDCENSLRNLGVEHIDLYYLHRWDRAVPIAESVGELARLKQEGKIGHIGLSEVSAQTLRAAHAEHPITALQSEYSLLTRNLEIAALNACRELGVVVVAFSPNGRALLSDNPPQLEALAKGDMRLSQPRYQPEHFARNEHLRLQLAGYAAQLSVSVSQIAQAWLLHKDEHLVVLPGTTSQHHMRDNLASLDIELSPDLVAALDELYAPERISGAPRGEATRHECDTESFPGQ